MKALSIMRLHGDTYAVVYSNKLGQILFRGTLDQCIDFRREA